MCCLRPVCALHLPENTGRAPTSGTLGNLASIDECRGTEGILRLLSLRRQATRARLAQVLLSLYPAGAPPARSIARWALLPEIRKLRVAEINAIDGLHAFVQRLPFYSGSEFRDENDTAANTPGAHSEDLTRLTYPDQSFDLILTSETLEHVPDLSAALREIHRVLAPGGRHVFTVPVLPATRETYSRAILGPDGSIQDRSPRICHPGGDWGYPVFTEFGTDLPELLRRAGFQTEVHFGPVTEDDLAQVYVCRKPGD